jgi:hypothetical protein
MTSVLIDSTIIENFNKKYITKFGKLKGADGKKVSNKRITAQVKSSLFESNNKVLNWVNPPLSNCQSSSKSFAGILGLDVFFEKDEILQMDFSTNKVCQLSASQLQEFLLDTEYKLVKSKCRWNQIFIYFSVEGKEYEFHVDTGYTGSIIFPNSNKLDFENKEKIELEGSLFQSISTITFGKEVLYEKMPIDFAGQHFESKANVSTSIKAQNIGFDFIKAFDWLIDYNNNKVYVKRNQNAISSTFNRKVMYYAKVTNEKLEVVVKEKSQTKFKLGDQITSVNGQKVTKENQCDLQDLLNKTEDWNSLQLEVVPNSN